ncbi:hypothetical protein [Sorangium sp. So ce1024]
MNDRLAAHMLDVGQGDCPIVPLPDARVVLLDRSHDRVTRKVPDG